MKEPKLTELDSVIELDNANEYIIQQMKDNEAFNQGFNLGKQSAFSNQHVQIQRIEGLGNTNDFLLGIPKENIIDIKPMEHNTYLIIYAEEEHEVNNV